MKHKPRSPNPEPEEPSAGDPVDGDPVDGHPVDGDPVDGDPVEVPITDVLDLHSFRPADILDVVRDYLDAAWEDGIRQLRIIHGRGIGAQRQAVRSLLAGDPRVAEFGDAPPEAGGWGATWVRLRG